MMRSFAGKALARDKRGTVVIIFALSAMVLAVITALVVNQVTTYMGKRRLQAAVDMTSMMMMRSSQFTQAHALSLVQTQIAQTNGVNVTVTRGRYTPSATTAAGARFVPNATPYNAIRVNASVPADPSMMSKMLPANLSISASAIAARRQTAAVEVGSRLVRVEGGLSAALLDALLGYNGKLTVMDYNSLASANVDAIQVLKSLNVKANINAVTFDDVLNAPVSVGDLVSVLAATSSDPGTVSLLAKAHAGSTKIKLSEVINLGAIKGLPLDALVSGKTIPISVGEVLTSAASISNGSSQVSVNLAAALGDTGIANASLDLGAKPKLMSFNSFAETGDKLKTSQFNLNIGALGKPPATLVAVDVQLAGAEVEVDTITCKADGTAEVKLKAKTEAAKLGVKALVLPKIQIDLGSNETKTISFTQADITAKTYKPVRSGLGLQVGSLNLSQLLLIKPVDDLLVKLGLNTAEADVRVTDANCGTAGLVY